MTYIINQGETAATVTSVAASTSAVDLFALNTNAKQRIVYNDSSAVLYLKFGASASTSSYTVQVAAQGTFTFPSIPIYCGQVSAVWASATGNARCTEA